MASATKREVVKTRTVEEKYTATDGVILELTHEEAALLAFILGHRTTGSGRRGPRALADGIWSALGPFGYHFRGKHYKDVTLHEADLHTDSWIRFKSAEEM